jgi:hypothetical protein
MALIVEDGTGRSDAESYASVATADAYVSTHGASAAWTALTTATKEGALRSASTALDGRYAWSGSVVSLTQALGWPRAGASDREGRYVASDSVPARVAQATCQLALMHITYPLDGVYERAGAIVREKVGPIETEYAPGAAVEPLLPQLDRTLGGLGTRTSACGSVPERS